MQVELINLVLDFPFKIIFKDNQGVLEITEKFKIKFTFFCLFKMLTKIQKIQCF